MGLHESVGMTKKTSRSAGFITCIQTGFFPFLSFFTDAVFTSNICILLVEKMLCVYTCTL